MTPEERAQLDRQKQIARTPEIKIQPRRPLDGQGSLFDRPKVRKKSREKRGEGPCSS